MRITVVLALLLASLRLAVAQPAMTAPASRFDVPTPPAVKDESMATALSLGSTALGYVFMFAAARDGNESLGWTGVALAIVGPSAGHIYAGEVAHAGEMGLVRTGGLLTMLLGVVSATSAGSGICREGADCSSHDSHGGAAALILIGGTAFVGATLYDLYDVHRAANRTNAREWLVTPTVMPSINGGIAPAVSVAGRF